MIKLDWDTLLYIGLGFSVLILLVLGVLWLQDKEIQANVLRYERYKKKALKSLKETDGDKNLSLLDRLIKQ